MTKSPVTFPSCSPKGAQREVTKEKQPRVKIEHGLVQGGVSKRTENNKEKEEEKYTGPDTERKGKEIQLNTDLTGSSF